jgi:hypothetical protein
MKPGHEVGLILFVKFPARHPNHIHRSKAFGTSIIGTAVDDI